MKREKIAYFEWLRLFAAFAVVLMHTAAKRWMSVSHETEDWLVLTMWDSLVRWPVPVFIMITGALFVPRKTDLNAVLRRYIPRVVISWAVWSAVNALYIGGTAEEILKCCISGQYHLWYLPFLCGVYLALPFVQKIAEDGRLTKQLLAVSCVVALLIPWLADLAVLIWPEAGTSVRTVENHLNFSFFFDHLAILLLGHVLHQTDLTPKTRRCIYIAGILGVAVTGVATVWASNRAGIQNSVFFDHAAPNTLCAAAALFVFAKYNLKRLPKLVERVASCSFGVYLCHAILIDILADRGIHVLTFDPVWSVPVLSAGIFAAALALTAVIAKIPVVGKYLT